MAVGCTGPMQRRGTTRLPVPLLDPNDSLELLRATAGAERIASDSPTVQQIADLLGHLPLALSVVGRHIRDHPAKALVDYYRESLLALALEDGVSDVRLPKGARRLLRPLAPPPRWRRSKLPRSWVNRPPLSITEATLAAAHLIERTEPSRFRLHPLTHAYAEERICIDVPATRIRQDLGHLLEHLTRLCWSMCIPRTLRFPTCIGRSGARSGWPLVAFRRTLGWMAREVPAAPRGWPARGVPPARCPAMV